MKKLHFACLVFMISFCVQSCTVREKKQSPPAVTVNEQPSLAITGLDGKSVIVKELTGKVVLILFQPDCDHCQREATAIREHAEAFAAYQVYFVSSSPMPELQKFFMDYKLDTLPNFHFATTTLENVLNSLGPISAPSLYVFSDGKQLGHFNGETDIREILRVL